MDGVGVRLGGGEANPRDGRDECQKWVPKRKVIFAEVSYQCVRGK